MNYALLDEIAHIVFKRKLSDKELAEGVIFILKHLETELPKSKFEKVIKQVRHSINRYLNFGSWEGKKNANPVQKISINRELLQK